ncbi:DNA-directed RNA polymerase subunit beta' [Parelusimicrobium proximum]|uniref:DNA-directed RNA polymerase subunit beta' n=1 Tax=Parelusimicrobium proximum TaxID=3228953 RepID=UPI003D183F2B
MQEKAKKMKKLSDLNFFDFDAMKLGIASPEQISAWSHGEVKKPETINYRTLKPERDGLFCERIFGPTKDYECSCGKYRWVKYKGIQCDRCGVEVTEAKVRRERLGHIELAVPVSHVWFLRKNPSRIGIILDMRTSDLERVVYYASYVVVEDCIDSVTGRTDFKKGELLSDSQVREARKKHGARLKVDIGAPAIKTLLASIDFDKEIPVLHEELTSTQSELERTKLIRRIKTMEEFKESGNRPEWMILSVLPVIPPDLRPLVPLDGGRFAASDLNDLYRRIINRNNRLKHIETLRAPEVMIYNEKRLLQEAVDALIENGARGKFFIGAGGRPLKSLSDVIKGKHGRFRQNLLGKRVDYSGRSVIVVGPNLKLHQCGLPKIMALELFKPFIIGELMKKEGVTLKAAKKMLERVRPEIWDILEQVTKNHPVMLNRAPTLHRLGIQAFEPVLIEGKAIQLHPLTCAAFNADFDGDQMAVHVPLSLEAQIEARTLMLATNNILSPASGRPIAAPSHDIVMGVNFITKVKNNDVGEGSVFYSSDEALLAYAYNKISLHAKIKVRGITSISEEGLGAKDMKNAALWKDYTSVGRIIFNNNMPKGWPYINAPVGKKELSAIVDECYKSKKYGKAEAVQLLDRIMKLGYSYATRSGLSISIADMIIPQLKQKYIDAAKKRIKEIQAQAEAGIITEGERYNKVIDIWTRVTDDVAVELFKEMKKFEEGEYKGGQRFNSVFLMADSGARGSRQQVRQLAGMRGLMAKPQKKLTGGQGEIIESPITANFREGLSVLEYFISTHGGRKGLSDTALKTADAGYLTRRLVDVGHNLVVTEPDCGTTNGIVVKSLMSGEEMVEPLDERILGRTSLENIVVKVKKGNGEEEEKTIIKEGDVITLEQSKLVKKYEVESVRIRSVLTCEAKSGVCAKCYGLSLATGNMSNVGDAVGIIAAQSIGEPGTQLTLRTFHIGGTASRVLSRSQAVAELDGKVTFKDIKVVTNKFDNKVCLSRNGSIFVEAGNGTIKEYKIQYGAILRVSDKEKVAKGALMAEWDPHSIPVLSEIDGEVKLQDVTEGTTLQEERNKVTGVIERKITASRVGKKNPRIVIEGKGGKKVNLPLPIDTILLVESGDEVSAGDVLAKIAREAGGTKDITGGLPRIAELFEARKPRNAAIISDFAGIVSLETSPKGLVEVVVRNEETGQIKQYSIPQGKHLVVYEGDHVAVGEALTDGAIDPHDVLRVKGIKEVQEFLLNAIQEVYRLQGVTINDRHIEVIVRQMLGNVRVLDPGDTSFLKGEILNKAVYLREQERVAAKGKKQAEAESILLGISKASLASESFISAASFQETTKVLTDAAITGQVDYLKGLKENVIVGHLIPAGTGISARILAEEFEEKRKEKTGE